MMYTNERVAYRQKYFTTWQKYQEKIPLDKLESELIEIMLNHPHYYFIFENLDYLDHVYTGSEENHFLHLSLHQSIREQLNTNRPFGINAVFQGLVRKFQDKHKAEHEMMSFLIRALKGAQQSGNMIGDEEYLEGLKALL